MAYVVNDLGETEYGRLDAIVGALTMEEWYIKLDPRRGELDLSGLRKLSGVRQICSPARSTML
jgi:hypothetical protein